MGNDIFEGALDNITDTLGEWNVLCRSVPWAVRVATSPGMRKAVRDAVVVKRSHATIVYVDRSEGVPKASSGGLWRYLELIFLW